jgi:hypothetical protein
MPMSDDIRENVRRLPSVNGTWTSEIEMQGQFAGMSMKGGGKWSLADGVVSYTSGANSGKSRVRLESGRLVLIRISVSARMGQRRSLARTSGSA